MTFGDDVISFSTIAVLSAHARVYGRQVSPKRSAHHSNFTGGIEARGMLVIAPPYPLSLDIFCNAARLRDGETLGLKAFDESERPRESGPPRPRPCHPSRRSLEGLEHTRNSCHPLSR